MSNINSQLNDNLVAPRPPEDVLREAISSLPDNRNPLESESSLSAFRVLQRVNRRLLRKIKNEILEKDLAYPLGELESRVNDQEGELDGGHQQESDLIVNIANNLCELVHDQSNEVYARTFHEGVFKTLLVRSGQFRSYMNFNYYTRHDVAPKEAALNQALSTLIAQGKYDGRRVDTAKRVYERDGVYYIDLNNDKGEVVEIDPNKKSIIVITNPPVVFIRPESMLALPKPEEGGDVYDLEEFINVPKSQFLLVLAWLTMCLRADVEYCLLELIGPQGSAKSSTQKYLKMLVDPNKPQLCRAPNKSDDLFVMADHHHLISLENMSKMSEEISDDCCTIITGGGTARRKLYTDSELSTIEIRKPIVINGIAPIVERQDLLDRTLHIETPKIKSRIAKSEIDARFNKLKGKIFGDILNLLMEALIELPKVNVSKTDLPRLADFAKWGEAVYRVLEQEPGEFIKDFMEMQKDGVHRTIESSPVAVAMKEFANKRPPHEGPINDLFTELEDFKLRGESWPKSPKGLANAIRRYGPALEKIGIEAKIDSQRTAAGYTCVLRKLKK